MANQPTIHEIVPTLQPVIVPTLQPVIVPTLQRGNASLDAPASAMSNRRSGENCIPTPERGNDQRRSVGTINANRLAACAWLGLFLLGGYLDAQDQAMMDRTSLSGQSEQLDQRGDNGDGCHHHAAEFDNHALLRFAQVAAQVVDVALGCQFGLRLRVFEGIGNRFRLRLRHAGVFEFADEFMSVEGDGGHGVPRVFAVWVSHFTPPFLKPLANCYQLAFIHKGAWA